MGRTTLSSVVDPIVLVVDDDEDLRLLYGAALKHLGYRTIDAENGAEGLRKARVHRPHVVLTDIAMPEVDGLEMARQIRADEKLRETFVVVMTAYGGTRFVEATEAGCHAFLCKPFNAFVLDAILQARFANRRTTVVKRCGCGREYTPAEWRSLSLCGTMNAIELRNCVCGSTVGLADE